MAKNTKQLNVVKKCVLDSHLIISIWSAISYYIYTYFVYYCNELLNIFSISIVVVILMFKSRQKRNRCIHGHNKGKAIQNHYYLYLDLL